MVNLKVIIDAGHSNNTPGKRAPDDSMREHHFNAAVTRYLDAELTNYEGVSTKFTHDPTGKNDVALKARTDAANSWKADVFVSIHANALAGKWHTGGGIETFVYKTNPKEARALATKVQAELIELTGLRNRGVKTADFHVLRESKMTAILVECGFMDNREELALLKSDDYRRKCAQAIANGLIAQYGLKRKKVVVTPTKPAPVKPQSTAPKPTPAKPTKLYRVQIGAYSKKANADAEAAKAKRAGYTPYIAVEGGLYKVQIGAYSVKANADKVAAELKKKGFSVFIA
ncbi:N-acetylmuramoyl-L-alanine amidase [Lederbergia citri]|uniref:N-acetylmuramoyl-L-alanine amidase n=1 Tax=Lederbergia citri TaxID=2833580 RepID=A0A942TEI4_9BACI|nr:N-acetylmuramoyl-L-alanine amidase [Lederbergia citri]MBS4195316.1 N-acetylmuramoyl-L-alanine amidase [Lederbergia citri]